MSYGLYARIVAFGELCQGGTNLEEQKLSRTPLLFAVQRNTCE